MNTLNLNTELNDSQQVHLHVQDTKGTGRPIVLIHGWPLSGASWKLQVLALQKQGYRVIAYDRRGFGHSDKPKTGYDYDVLAEDLNALILSLDLHDLTLVGFSMGGGEVARYISKYGESRIHSVVFASSVTPMLLNTLDNPEGPLLEPIAIKMANQLSADPEAFYIDFFKKFYSPNADGAVMVTEEELQNSLSLAKLADKIAAQETLKSFSVTDFRKDLTHISVPTLVIHGDADGIVNFKGSADRTHKTINHREFHLIKGGPHGINVSHADEFNNVLLAFLSK